MHTDEEAYFPPDLLERAGYATCFHRPEIENSEICGCHYCLSTFSPSSIRAWDRVGPGATAECPHCGIEAVLGASQEVPFSEAFLRAMQRQWFPHAIGTIIGPGWPVGEEYTWLGCDEAGCLAVLSNNVRGPIPKPVLTNRPLADMLDSLLQILPKRGSNALNALASQPDPYFPGADHGLFVYRWNNDDAIGEMIAQYEKTATPSGPLNISELDLPLATLAELGRIRNIHFSETDSFGMETLVEWEMRFLSR